MIYVMLVKPDGKASAVKGPFGQDQTNEIYGAIEEFERDYRLGDRVIGSLLEGGKVHVVKAAYTKEYDLL